MKGLRTSQSDNRIGCRIILDRLRNASNDSEKTILLWDFLTKFMKSGLEKVDPVIFEAFEAFISPKYQEAFRLLKRSKDGTILVAGTPAKKEIDVLILTIVLQELTAAKIALNIPLDQEPDEQVEGLRCWGTEISRSNEDRPLRVLLSMVGIPRTTPCALACETLFYKYKIEEASVLVGIAAGVEEKVKCGDVVAAKSIIDYEGGRIEETGKRNRPDPYPLKYKIRMDLANYEPTRLRWHEQFQTAFEKLQSIEEVPGLEDDWKPDYHWGVILSGEKVIADGSLQIKREEYTDEMRALEMEGSGFAAAWHKHDIPWLIFRGISDYGEQSKKGTKVWQTTAALAAATATVNFFSNTYTRRKAPVF